MRPWWSTASIRVRLTAWYAVVLALMLVVYATATFVAVRHEFFEQFDDQLHDDFETAEGFLTATDGGRIAWSGDRRHDPDDEEDRGSDVTVADNGAGIAPEHRVRIFDRFVRLDEARSRDNGGTGLGLAIAKWAVEVNGGQISVEGGVDGGALFRTVLPIGATPLENVTQIPLVREGGR